MFSPFASRNFRFQWGADLTTSWATEMETLILGWYIYATSNSIVYLTIFAALQYCGTLIAPLIGLGGDRIGHKQTLCAMRVSYAVLAMIVGALAAAGQLSPLSVLAIAAVGGLIRPSDIGMRNVMIGHMLPGSQLMSAIGLARLTVDSARIGGALMGASAIISIGMVWAYVIVAGLYWISVLLLLPVKPPVHPPAVHHHPSNPWRNLIEGMKAVWEAPAQLAAMVLAFQVNLTAFPFMLGLLPYIARDIYGAGEQGLGYLVAAVSAGSVIGALILTRAGATVWPARMMLIFCLLWHGLVIALGISNSFVFGLAVLTLTGAASMLCLLPVTVLLLRGSPPGMQGRVMGMRTQAVYGLPLGQLLSGPLIEKFGFSVTAAGYGIVGAVATLFIFLKWRRDLWPVNAPANQG